MDYCKSHKVLDMFCALLPFFQHRLLTYFLGFTTCAQLPSLQHRLMTYFLGFTTCVLKPCMRTKPSVNPNILTHTQLS